MDNFDNFQQSQPASSTLASVGLAPGRWFKVYESPMPAEVMDALAARDMWLTYLSKSGRKHAQLASQLVDCYDRVLTPAVANVARPLAQGINTLIWPYYQSQRMLPEDLTPDLVWDFDHIEANRAGRLRIAIRPDFLHTTSEFSHIVEQVLPHTDRRFGLWFDQSNTRDQAFVNLITVEGAIDPAVVRAYRDALKDYGAAPR